MFEKQPLVDCWSKIEILFDNMLKGQLGGAQMSQLSKLLDEFKTIYRDKIGNIFTLIEEELKKLPLERKIKQNLEPAEEILRELFQQIETFRFEQIVKLQSLINKLEQENNASSIFTQRKQVEECYTIILEMQKNIINFYLEQNSPDRHFEFLSQMAKIDQTDNFTLFSLHDRRYQRGETHLHILLRQIVTNPNKPTLSINALAELVALMVKRFFDPRIADDEKNTALDYAAKGCLAKVLYNLFTLKSDVSIQEKERLIRHLAIVQVSTSSDAERLSGLAVAILKALKDAHSAQANLWKSAFDLEEEAMKKLQNQFDIGESGIKFNPQKVWEEKFLLEIQNFEKFTSAIELRGSK